MKDNKRDNKREDKIVAVLITIWFITVLALALKYGK